MNFEEHLNKVLTKVNTIGLLRKLKAFLPHQSLVTVYKAFVRPNLNYGDITYNQTYNDSFHQNLESIQYNGTLAIIGTIRGTSREKFYQSFHKRR